MADPATLIVAAVAVGVLSRVLAPDPPDIEGSRIRDMRIQGSAYGGAIPIVLGRSRLAGNVIWADKITEFRNIETVSSKGGPSNEVTSYSYTVSFAVALCQGEIAGIRRIWQNSKLIYDVSDSASLSAVIQSKKINLRFYPGSETQEPDPLIEALEGVGCAPAYRGTCYVVIEDFPLGSAPQMPNLEFELLQNASDGYLSDDVWHDYPTQETGFLVQHPVGAIAPHVVDFRVVRDPWPRKFSSSSLIYQESIYGSSSRRVPVFIDRWKNDPASGGSSYLLSTLTDIIAHNAWFSVDTMTVYAGVFGLPGVYNCFINNSVVNDGEGTVSRFVWAYDGEAAVASIRDTSGTPIQDVVTGNAEFGRAIFAAGDLVSKDGWIYAIEGAAQNETENLYVFEVLSGAPQPVAIDEYNESSGWVFQGLHDNGEYIWAASSNGSNTRLYRFVRGTATVDKSWTITGQTLGDDAGIVVNTVGDIAVILNRTNAKIYRLKNSGTTLLGTVTTGLTEAMIPVNYENAAIQFGSKIVTTGLLDDGGVDLDVAVADILERSGITDYDLSAISSDVLDGLAETRVQSSRSVLENLTRAYNFDLIESDWQIKAVSRGGAAVVTVPETDLGAGNESAGELIEITRQQDSELPKEVAVSYIASGSNYQTGTQRAQRVNPNTTRVVKIDLPMIFNDARAKQIAESVMYEAWHSRERYHISLPPQYAYLDSADLIEVEHDDAIYLMRVDGMNYGPAGAIQIEATRDNPRLYGFDYDGAASDFPADTMNGVPGPTLLHLLDVPTMQNADDGATYYLGVSGILDDWRGAAIEYSDDDRQTWRLLDRITFNTAYGQAEQLASGPTEIWDRGNTLVVRTEATLTSSTEAAVLNGANAALLGRHGRWEVLQFVDATDNGDGTYDLSMLLRGRQGTEHNVGNHQADDTFILLQQLARFTDLNVLDIARHWRVTSFGETVDSSQQTELTIDGEALMPYAPVHLKAERDGLDIVLSATRRSRKSAGYRYLSVSPPLAEASESYVWEILSGSTVVRTLTSSTPTVTYDQADQLDDFTILQTQVKFNVYQVSSVVGRGNVASATIHVGLNSAYATAVLTDDPTVYLRLGESSGTTALDSSGNGNHGTYSGPTLGTAGLLSGDADTAITLDGVDDIVTLPNLGFTSRSEATLEALCSFTSATGTKTLISMHSTDLAAFYTIRKVNKKIVAFARGTASPDDSVTVTSSGDYDDGNPHLVHAVIDGQNGDVTLYVDGVEEGSGTHGGAFANKNLDKVNFGAQRATVQHWDGVQDESAVYPSLLSAATISQRATIAGV